ncbi:MAG: hypothetical protein KDA45_16550, partial [Planctomycetales bacterium]|nr:hypothetical protein [Planctomycetales bacterium]
SMLEPAQRQGTVRHKSVRLQGTRQWETVWQTLVEFAEAEGLCKVHMDLNVPWLEEGFHGTWQRSRLPDRLDRWSTALPIFADGRIAGRLDIAGPATDGQAIGAIAKLVELVDDLIPQIELLLTTPIPLEAVETSTESAETESAPVGLDAAQKKSALTSLSQ